MNQKHIFLDETGCVLNEKMMPDVAVMVPDLEIHKNMSKVCISQQNKKHKKRGGTPVLHVHDDGYKIDTAMHAQLALHNSWQVLY
jgi:hypothetical protein